MKERTAQLLLVLASAAFAVVACGGGATLGIDSSDAAAPGDDGEVPDDGGAPNESSSDAAAPEAPQWTAAEAIPADEIQLAMDHAGNVALAGRGGSNFNFGAGYTVPDQTNVFSALLDAHGNPSAVTGVQAYGTGGEPLLFDLTTNPAGDFILVGLGTASPMGRPDPFPCSDMIAGSSPFNFDTPFVARYAPGTPAKGNTCFWLQLGPDATAGGWQSVAADAQGNVFLGGWGTYQYASTSPPAFLTKFEPKTGKQLWSVAPPLTADIVVADRIATDSAGNVYVFGGSSGGLALLKYDGSGVLAWSRVLGGTYPLQGASYAVTANTGLAVDADGNATVAADFSGVVALDGQDAGAAGGPDFDAGTGPAFLVSSFDASGSFRWGHAFPLVPDPNLQTTTVKPKVALGAHGEVVVGGTYWSTLDLGAGPLPSSGMTKGDRNVFLGAFDPAGKLLWSKAYGSPHTNTLSALAGDGTGVVAAVGTFTDTIAFGSTTLTATIPSETFLAVLR